MRVLIVKTSSLGDVVHAFPVATYLKSRPEVDRVDWLVDSGAFPLVAAHPHVDKAIELELKKWKRHPFSLDSWRGAAELVSQLRAESYALVFDLQGNCKSGVLTALSGGTVRCGFDRGGVAELPNLLFTHHKFPIAKGENVREDYLSLVMQYFGECKRERSFELVLKGGEPPSLPSNTVLLCPGSLWPNKQLSEELIIEVVGGWLKQVQVSCSIVWGSDKEKEWGERLVKALPRASLLPLCSLVELQQVMEQAVGVVAMDSLPLHLAGLGKVPTFGFFGPSSPHKYAPEGKGHGHFFGACPYGEHFHKRCPQLRRCATGACLKSVEGKRLQKALLQWSSGEAFISRCV